jgi:hypothetical protein
MIVTEQVLSFKLTEHSPGVREGKCSRELSCVESSPMRVRDRTPPEKRKRLMIYERSYLLFEPIGQPNRLG